MTLLFISYLDPEYLEQMAQIESWMEIAGDQRLWNNYNLKQIFPKLTIIDERFWSTKIYEIQNATAIKPIDGVDKRAMIPVLKILSSQVEGDAGMTLLTIPKGLSINKVATLSESFFGLNIINFWQKFRDICGNIEVDKTYRVVITNNVLLGTRNLSFQAQKDLVNNLGIGCEFPRVIEMVTLLITTLMKSNTRLFTDSPSTYSSCEEIVDDCQLLVGNSHVSGFRVCCDRYYSMHCGLQVG